jgi:hypothetical protein
VRCSPSDEAEFLQEFTDEEIADIDSVISEDKSSDIPEPDHADMAFDKFLESLPS